MASNESSTVLRPRVKPNIDIFHGSLASCPSCNKQLPYESISHSKVAVRDRKTTDCDTCRAIFQATAELYQRAKGFQGSPSFFANPRWDRVIRAVDVMGAFCADLDITQGNLTCTRPSVFACQHLQTPDCPDEDLQGAIAVNNPRRSIDQTVGTCRRWLKDCISDHPGCQPWSRAYFPLRVLDLSRVDTESLVFLVERTRQDYPVPGQYACLSHCWGGSQPVKTTKDNQTRHMRAGVPLRDLPLTFRDAVTVTRALGIEFLWIDSLCIIQGDDQDWQTQAAEMAAIYGSSSITIAATSAAGCHDGFLDELRQARQQTSCHHSTMGSRIVVAIEVPSHASWQFGSTEDISEKLPLQRRAWTLQEYVLPPRVLSFGNNEAVWACQSEMDCECGEAVIEANSFLDVSGKLNLKKWFSQTTADLDKKSNLLGFWASLVCMYANRSLSYEIDRTVALQGIVDLLRQKTNYTPCYGHWYDNLVETLRWVGPTNKCTSPAVWRAPTWSWLSLEYQPGAFSYNSRPIESDSPFTAEALAIKGLGVSEAVTSKHTEEWDDCPAGTLWLRAWAGDGVLRAGVPGDDPSTRLDIPSLSRFISKRSETNLHTDAFGSEDIEIRFIILATGDPNIEMIICRRRGAGEPLARIGSCQYWDDDEDIRFSLLDHFVNEMVAIW